MPGGVCALPPHLVPSVASPLSPTAPPCLQCVPLCPPATHTPCPTPGHRRRVPVTAPTPCSPGPSCVPIPVPVSPCTCQAIHVPPFVSPSLQPRASHPAPKSPVLLPPPLLPSRVPVPPPSLSPVSLGRAPTCGCAGGWHCHGLACVPASPRRISVSHGPALSTGHQEAAATAAAPAWGTPRRWRRSGEAGGRGLSLAPPPPGPAEVELTWQEILSLSELQGLDMVADTPIDPSPFCSVPPPSPYTPLPPPHLPTPSPPPPLRTPHSPPPFPTPPLPTSFPAEPPAHPAARRDARRASALALPIGPEAIVNLPVEDFNALLGRARLSGPELALARDIRRRGKNKVAAQKCRRRKLEAIAQLQAELGSLGQERERLLRVRGQAERALGALRRDLAHVSAQVLGALRDGAGNPLPPECFGLRLAPDGELSLESPGLGE
ncbi:transcription factor NF-E2 45 kDa subunit [Falco peregrinus]|uniref:transcription factor NF-E2 45 kDa subunit n=1 Tax=Falco peregrinus TaxID=8954 RepID=UPI0024798156|nr:transcription factor NF-E2 45 kDa subunit [Falco peregrinus]